MAELQVPVHAGDHSRGGEGAPATLVIYGDYECPYTRQAYRVVQRLLAEEPEVLRFVFRHFPLTSIHPHAEHASEAAEAAAAQGKFWEMHDALFAHQHALEDTDLRHYADDLALDGARFTRDLETHATKQRIADEVGSGRASGVQGTPTLYFNGHLHAGGYDEATLRAAIAHLAANASSST
jgi:protein-disulfide isomerase